MLVVECDGWGDGKLTDAHWNSSNEALKAFWDGHEHCNPHHDKTGGEFPLNGSQEWHTDAKGMRRPLRGD